MDKNGIRDQFIGLVSEYSRKKADEITPDSRFREDLEFSSLDFMAFLGDLEDLFDVEVDEERALRIITVEDALNYIDDLVKEAV
ncbi:MAG: phosphopantetheine-binding protein [Lachnospiraceae bacterium]|nr:phosphopantetheine-binding protein [Lachnospiraceae bacterium]